MISSLAPLRKLVSPNVGVPCVLSPEVVEKNGRVPGEETRGSVAMMLDCDIFGWDDNGIVGCGERGSPWDGRAEPEGGGKNDNSESGTRLMAEPVIVCVIDEGVLIVSVLMDASHSETLLHMHESGAE